VRYVAVLAVVVCCVSVGQAFASATFSASQDGYSCSLNPNTTEGSGLSYVRIDRGTYSGPWEHWGYFKFDLSSMPGDWIVFDNATLKLYWNNDGSETTYGDIYATQDGWNESTITWNGTQGMSRDKVGSFAEGSAEWLSYDVTSAFTSGTKWQDGVLSFCLDPTSADGTYSEAKSHESGATYTARLEVDGRAPGLPAFALIGAAPVVGAIAKRLRRK